MWILMSSEVINVFYSSTGSHHKNYVQSQRMFSLENVSIQSYNMIYLGGEEGEVASLINNYPYISTS